MTAVTTTGADVAFATAHADERGRLATWWKDSLVFAARNIEHIRQIPEKLLDVTLQPLMFVLLFAYVFGGAIHVGGGNYREYIIAGILIQSLAFGMTGPATAIATDLTEGVIDRFRSLPASRVAYVTGHYFAEIAGMALSIVVLLGAGLVVGWRAHTDFLHIFTAIALLLTFSSTVMCVGFVAVFPLTFLSNAFVPIATMPEALQWIAAWNPISVMVAAVRELFGNPLSPLVKHTWPLEHPIPAAFIYCAVILAITVPAALRRYRIRTSD